jgi:hypothetical protein
MNVFVSYSSVDKELAESVMKALNEHNLTPIASSKDLKEGANWQDEIDALLKRSQAIVLLIGKKGADALREREWRAALEAVWSDPKKRLIPFVYGSAELPAFLRNWQALRIDSQSEWNRSVDKLIKVLQSKVNPNEKSKVLKDDKAEQKDRLLYIEKGADTLRVIVKES